MGYPFRPAAASLQHTTIPWHDSCLRLGRARSLHCLSVNQWKHCGPGAIDPASAWLFSHVSDAMLHLVCILQRSSHPSVLAMFARSASEIACASWYQECEIICLQSSCVICQQCIQPVARIVIHATVFAQPFASDTGHKEPAGGVVCFCWVCAAGLLLFAPCTSWS